MMKIRILKILLFEIKRQGKRMKSGVIKNGKKGLIGSLEKSSRQINKEDIIRSRKIFRYGN